MAATILDLRALLAERYPQSFIPRAAAIATGIQALDEMTDGGLPQGAITELTTPHASAGSASIIVQLLQEAQRQGSFLALIDGGDSFDPCGCGDNLLLRHLFWLRCRKANEAIKSADLLLRDANFPLIVLDLVLNRGDELRKIPQTSWYRLQRLVEPSPTAFLVLTRRTIIGSAQLKLRLENRWRIADIDSESTPARFRFTIERVHGARPQFTQTG